MANEIGPADGLGAAGFSESAARVGESGGARKRGGEEEAAGSHARMLTGRAAQLKPERRCKNLMIFLVILAAGT
jgi:hypothetical protein